MGYLVVLLAGFLCYKMITSMMREPQTGFMTPPPTKKVVPKTPEPADEEGPTDKYRIIFTPNGTAKARKKKTT